MGKFGQMLNIMRLSATSTKIRNWWGRKAILANIEALEVGNSRLEEEVAELSHEIHRLQAKADERLASYAERTYQHEVEE